MKFGIDTKLFKKIDWGLVFIIIVLCTWGVIMVASATRDLDSARYVKTQISSVVVGIVAVFIILSFDYKLFEKIYIHIYVISNVLLIIVLLFGQGKEQWGADRWIRIGGFGFQPSDFVKIAMIICLAKVVDDHKKYIDYIPTLGKILAFIGFPMLLILIQPDLGTTLAFGVFTFGILFIAGLKYKYILNSIMIGIFSLPFLWMGLKDYQKSRIMVFLNPEEDPTGSGYHILQSKIAIGSGEFWGSGIFKGIQHIHGFLPEKHTDFIFSMLTEELGFLGSGILILLYLFLIYRCINIARNARDDFGKYLVMGITFMISFHIIANIAMTMGLMPITGKPLPFMSYGGTFMLSNMIAVGIVLNVNMRRDKINF
ncbi:rod shape-determining protein RodA [Anaerophilus nitritogenes]|uniref:rod shape-determining protein RodA n=1 Tax=Anaerophilus nitritogenes TaxID=2498136 RepID=UPI001FAA41A1|nr:rod shape-determining protein RodA [Anaerophilus nitritogenes]